MTKTGRGPRWWTGTMTSEWKNGEGIQDLPFALRLVIGTWRAVVLVPACTVLLLLCCLDFLPRRGSKQSTYPQLPMRKLPILLHEKGAFFAINPDGSKVEIDPLLFSEHFRQCSSALAAAMVYEKTKIVVDENR